MNCPVLNGIIWKSAHQINVTCANDTLSLPEKLLFLLGGQRLQELQLRILVLLAGYILLWDETQTHHIARRDLLDS